MLYVTFVGSCSVEYLDDVSFGSVPLINRNFPFIFSGVFILGNCGGIVSSSTSTDTIPPGFLNLEFFLYILFPIAANIFVLSLVA